MKKVNDKSISITIEKRLHEHKIELRIGNWSKKFDLNYVNIIIAMTLNHCTKNKDFIIKGYLITSKTVYLILKTNEKTFDNLLKKIEIHIHFLLKIHKKQIQNSYENDFIADEEDSTFYTIRRPLFKLQPLKNEHLVLLITGKKVVLPYYNRELEDLKLFIRNHPFCSAIDYSGAIGPVDMTLLND
ncbi:hypothetical protein [Flavobacterium salmonis]|uniref:Uncharacterized protein n=1 Tax=Flavobacterium salmonis TaxID=2654844 RepID=A0A6V6ZBG5_9FLAO|nr:hypothetical protein [Flavobacterium salmonis]CAD0009121.1 hypothetical protein FLAT13_04758 [Flavobacterium salmonis]